MTARGISSSASTLPTKLPTIIKTPQEQRQIIRDRFQDVGWRTADLLRAWDITDNFYFDKLSQIKMPPWDKRPGRPCRRRRLLRFAG